MKKIDFTKPVIVDGELFVNMEGKQRIMDFMPNLPTVMEPFVADFRVQAMRDGNIYMTERKPRVRNKPLFREDNSSLSLGRDGRFYFTFSLNEQQLRELPTKLRRQADLIADKVETEFILR